MKLLKEERELLFSKIESRKKKVAILTKNELYLALVEGLESDGIYEKIYKSLEYSYKTTKLSQELKNKLV